MWRAAMNAKLQTGELWTVFHEKLLFMNVGEGRMDGIMQVELEKTARKRAV